MTSSVVEPLDLGTGVEDVTYAAFEVLISGLNDEITLVESERRILDSRIAQLREVPDEPVDVERVETEHFHLGHHPTLILDETPIDSFPAVSVAPYRMDPAGFDAQQDQMSAFTVGFYVEAMVKSSPDEGEEVCNRRRDRTLDAIHRVVMKNQTLNGAVFGVGQSPRALLSEVFTRPRSDTDDTDWFWQAGRLEYGVDKFSPYQ